MNQNLIEPRHSIRAINQKWQTGYVSSVDNTTNEDDVGWRINIGSISPLIYLIFDPLSSIGAREIRLDDSGDDYNDR